MTPSGDSKLGAFAPMSILVLQGGGALGAYQAGAYEALCRHDFSPAWVAGISIGAINAAIIAGNPVEMRVGKLREFWEMASAPVPWKPFLPNDNAHTVFNEMSALQVAAFGVPGFFAPRVPPAQFFPSHDLAQLSYYDTTPLRATLERLVDFELLDRPDVMRFSVGAVNVATGNLVYFDNTQREIRPEHIMASAALPPGFPAIKIGEDYFWDGGIASNTPLNYVLEHERSRDLMIFQVDLFSARGPLPTSLLDAAEREKDIRFSSRTRASTDHSKRVRNTIAALRDLIKKLPEELLKDPSVAILKAATQENSVSVIHLIYRQKNHEGSSKDYNFSRLNAIDHWRSGAGDVDESMKHPEWMQRPQNGATMVTWDLCRETENAAPKHGA